MTLILAHIFPKVKCFQEKSLNRLKKVFWQKGLTECGTRLIIIIVYQPQQKGNSMKVQITRLFIVELKEDDAQNIEREAVDVCDIDTDYYIHGGGTIIEEWDEYVDLY